MLKRLRFQILLLVLIGGVIAGAQAPQPPTQQTPPPPSAPPPPAAAQPGITFKVDIEYVEVDAVVTDGSGNFVRDLTQKDFQILEDGKPQTITVFSQVDLPVERAEKPLFADRPIEPDVITNVRPFDGRIYVIVLDDLHTNVLRSQRVRAAARRFIEQHFGANDLASVLHTSGRTDAAQEFTSNPRLLLAAVDKFQGRKLRSPTLELLEEEQRTRDIREQGDRIRDPADFERGFNARNALEVLANVAEWMGGIRGRRKALVYISEGIDYDIHDVFNNTYASTIMDEARETIAAATRSNVNIYAIDPRGLTSLGDEAIEIGSLPEDTSLGLGPQSLLSDLRLAQDSLRVLADETGGFAAVNSNDFGKAFERLVRDNSSYYVLGYYPTNTRRDGRFRKIDVRVTRPGVEVRARRGYVAPRGKAPSNSRSVDAGAGAPTALRDVLNSPLPVSGLRMSAFVAPFKGTAPNASLLVTVQLDGRSMTFTERDNLFHNKLELSVLAIDEQGKVRGASERQTVELKLKPDTYQAVKGAGFRLESRVEVPPGRYQIRIAGHEAAGGASGSVHYDLEVPDFSKQPFSMSGVALTSASAGFTPTARRDEQMKQVLPAPSTTQRVFVPADEIALFAEVYDNAASSPHKVDIKASVRADDGRVVFETTETRSSEELQGARGGYGFVARVPLRDLAPGLYVLRVDAQSRLGDGRTAARETAFRIVSPAPAARE